MTNKMNHIIGRWRMILLLSGIFIAFSGVILFVSDETPHLVPFDSYFSDYFRVLRADRVASQRNREKNIALVNVKDAFLNQLPYRSPLDRCVLSYALESILSLNPKAIGIDYLFDDGTEPMKDQRLRRIFNRYSDRIVVAKAPNNFLGNNSIKKKSIWDSPELDRMRGSALLIKDHDGVVRRASLFDGANETFALKLVKIFNDINANTNVVETFQIDWLSMQRKNFINLPIDYFVDKEVNKACHVNLELNEFPPLQSIRRLVENKIVIIGADLANEDRHQTPFDVLETGPPLLSGAQIHGQVIQQILDRRHFENISFPLGMVLITFAFSVGFLLDNVGDLVKNNAFVLRFGNWINSYGVFFKINIFNQRFFRILMSAFIGIIGTALLYLVTYLIELISIVCYGVMIPTGPIMIALGAPLVVHLKQVFDTQDESLCHEKRLPDYQPD